MSFRKWRKKTLRRASNCNNKQMSTFRWSSPLGLPPAAAQRFHAALHELHRVEESRLRSVQNCRPTRAGQTLGHPEEPSVHELRQDVTGPAILLSSEHSAQGARRETLLPVSALSDISTFYLNHSFFLHLRILENLAFLDSDL